MDQKLQHYFEAAEQEIGKSEKCTQEMDDIMKFLNKLYACGLINKEEFQIWSQRLNRNTGNYVCRLNLSVRAQNGLNRGGVRTFQQLRDVILKGKLLDIRTVGIGTGRQIIIEALKNDIIQEEELKSIYRDYRWEKLLSLMDL